MAKDKLSAREAALIAQARAELGRNPATAPQRAEASPARFAEAKTAPPAAAPALPQHAAPAANADPAARLAALMAAARADSERLRQRQRRLFVWAPVAFMSVLSLWALAWLWHML